MPNFTYKTQVQIVCATMTIHNFIRRNSDSAIGFDSNKDNEIFTKDSGSHVNVVPNIDADIISLPEMNRICDSIRY